MSNVTIRPATLEDSETLLSWANGADSLAWKQNTHSVISSADHHEWLQARLSDKETALWIIMAADRPVGQLRLEKERQCAYRYLPDTGQPRQWLCGCCSGSCY